MLSMSHHRPNLLASLLTMKCPSCRRERVFVQQGVFPLRHATAVKNECRICGEKLTSMSNNGGGLNYALSMLLFLVNLSWYWPVFGLSYDDNSVFYYLGVSTAIVILAQPYLMRLSRVIYLYLYIGFGHSRRIELPDHEDRARTIERGTVA